MNGAVSLFSVFFLVRELRLTVCQKIPAYEVVDVQVLSVVKV